MSGPALAADALHADVLEAADAQQVQDAEPDGDAPQHADHQRQVELAVPLHVRVHTVTLLWAAVAVQLAWASALGYGLYLLVR
jgi:hypothetical protein